MSGKVSVLQKAPNELYRREVFCRYITVKGKRIYPKNAKAFHFWVK